MDLGLIIAIVGSAIAIVGVMLILFLWNRGESNNDRREFRGEVKDLRRELVDCVRAIEAEMKDFHNRLCEIERSKR